jgi:hypothetical protein
MADLPTLQETLNKEWEKKAKPTAQFAPKETEITDPIPKDPALEARRKFQTGLSNASKG